MDISQPSWTSESAAAPLLISVEVNNDDETTEMSIEAKEFTEPEPAETNDVKKSTDQHTEEHSEEEMDTEDKKETEELEWDEAKDEVGHTEATSLTDEESNELQDHR